MESKDDRDWDFAILSLTDCILWDRDFLDEDIYDGSERLPDYFAPSTPDWTPRQQRDLQCFYDEIAREVDGPAAYGCNP